MSVPVNRRGHGKLEANVKALDLCTYTIQITKNKNVFTEEYQEAITDRIIATAIEIHMLCWTANNILVNSPEDLANRLSLQEQAAIQCNNLLSLIQIAKPLFHLSSKRVVYWGGKAVDTRNLIRAWHDSDRNRYAKKFH